MSCVSPIAMKFCGQLDFSNAKLWEKVSFPNKAYVGNGVVPKLAVLPITGHAFDT